MKIISKRVLICVVTIIVLFVNSPVLTARQEINAGGGGGTYDDNVETNPDYFRPNSSLENNGKLVAKISIILGIINAVGIVCSVIMIIVLGLKYMTGSIEEKAEYKRTIPIYLLGAALLFSSTTIPNIIYKLKLFS